MPEFCLVAIADESEMEFMTTRRIIFINRYFWPDHSATSQILSDLVFALAQENYQIEIVTSRLSYTDADKRYPPYEEKNGVRIHRVVTTGLGRTGILRRTIDYVSFYFSAVCKAFALARAGDVLVVKTDPPLLSLPMWPVARLRGAVHVNWLQDIYPEVAAKLGMRLFDGMLGDILVWLRNCSLRGAGYNVVLGERMADKLREAGVDESKIAVIPNFTDDETVRPLPVAGNKLREAWGYSPDQFVIGYSGNLGKAHDLATAIEAARMLNEERRHDIRFLFIGGGALFSQIDQEKIRHGLTNVDLQPYQPREKLSESLCVPDLHWMSLNPSLEGYIVPSKFYGSLAAGRGVLFVGDSDGEIARAVRIADCGWTVRPGDAESFAERVKALADDRSAAVTAGLNARSYMEQHCQRNKIFALWRKLFTQLP